MTIKHKPLGEVLIEAGVITHEQLDRVLRIQMDNPQRTIGEIISATYAIPMEYIEAVFVESILIPSIQDMLTESLKQEAEEHTDAVFFSIQQLIYEIDIQSITLKRIVTTAFSKIHPSAESMSLDCRKTNTEIGGKLRLTIKTQDDQTLCDPLDMLSYMYEFETGKALFPESTLEGIRFLFSRKIREQKGEMFVFQPLRQDEMEAIFKQL